jgi:polysaccharide export outer membrane protein
MELNIEKKRLSRLPAVVVCLLLLTTSQVFAQDKSPTQTKPAAQTSGETKGPNIIINAEEDYRIGVSDVIEIKVEDAAQLNGTFRVPTSGAIFMNYLKRIAVLNKTTEELEQMIANGLRDKYLKDPQVHVTVLQINSRSFFIQGAVVRPGVYQIEGSPSLIKLITIAGGLNENCGSTAYILRESKTRNQGAANGQGTVANDTHRPQTVAMDSSTSVKEQDTPANPDYELFTVNINKFHKGQVPQNLVILPGDIITIPVTDVFFVAGEVYKPGEFSLKEGTTLRQALSLAQGTKFEAAASKTIIFREDPATGKREEIQVDLSAVMSAKKSDMAIMPNDIIIVPNSRMKSIGGALLKAFGATARMPIP